MSNRELVVLGTASQVPTRHRNHNGYLLLWDGHGILFDPGEGTQRQMIMAEVSASQITQICITHFHGDHCLGLAGIIQRISLDGVPHEVPVHYPAMGQVFFDRLRRASIFKDMSRIRPCPIQSPGFQASIGELRLTAMPLAHTVECWGYRITEPDGRRVLPDRAKALGVTGPAIGRLLREGSVQVGDRTVMVDEVTEIRRGQSAALIMDTRPCSAAVELSRDVDLLICESTYLTTEEREAHERGHMTARDAGRLAAESGARRLVLTHFSQRYPHVGPFLEEARAEHDDVVAARDGRRVPMPIRRR